jgi:hypothetical protein
MNFLASLVRRQQSTVRTPASTGPKLINEKDFRHVGGGAQQQLSRSTIQSPRGGW